MNQILVKTMKARDRYRLMSGGQGQAGEPLNHVNHRYHIVEGIDRGNGYQGYISVSYFLTLDYVPKEAKDKVLAIIKKENLIY
jgi:hypothetical protein